MSRSEELLARGSDQRLREFRYRCAQSVIFGIPVFALHLFGNYLGGPETPRWVAIFQALLAGWVVYVGAAGMFFEGALLLVARRRITLDFIVAVIAIAMYLFSLLGLLRLLIHGQASQRLLMFHAMVLLVIAWTAARWFRFARASESVRVRLKRGADS